MAKALFESAGSRKARRGDGRTTMDSEMMKDLAGSGANQLERNPWERKSKTEQRKY
ncbi:MAG: hypothetical protein V1875_00180 [Candidatus Altiarchaeota archaeon]